MKRITALLISVILCLSLSGCAESTAGEQETKSVPDFAPLTGIVEGRKNIYLIVKIVEGSSYWQIIMDGAKDGGIDFDCNVYYSGTYLETDWESHEKLLDAAAAAGADAILLAPNDSVNLSGKIDEIHKKGIPVVLIDTIANTDSYDICYMTDNLMAGQKAAEEMISQLTKNGIAESESIQIGIQVGATSSQTIIERLSGFFQYWSKYAPDSWEVIPDIKCNEGSIDKAVECAEELLAYPDIKGVFGTNNGSTVGFARAVRDRELKDIAVVGFDYSEEIAGLIDDGGYIASTILQNQYYMGYTGVESALALTEGQKMPVKFADTGVVVVNKDNIDQSEVQEALLHN
ncbi:MAG: substrate-binding domain-containing protein [Oscillospiraceae bacterium]|nr:substrate-binding domain-containing protein [Oscillospiraceae bacterium]